MGYSPSGLAKQLIKMEDVLSVGPDWVDLEESLRCSSDKLLGDAGATHLWTTISPAEFSVMCT